MTIKNKLSIKNFDSLPDSAHVSVKIVATLIGMSPASVWRMTKNGKLPSPKKFGDRSTRWNVGSIREALDK